jgi:hypothetical protein
VVGQHHRDDGPVALRERGNFVKAATIGQTLIDDHDIRMAGCNTGQRSFGLFRFAYYCCPLNQSKQHGHSFPDGDRVFDQKGFQHGVRLLELVKGSIDGAVSK